MYFNHLNYPAAWRAEYSKYPEGLSILESLMQWVRQVDDMVDSHNANQTTINGFGDRLDDFIAQYDTQLQSTLTSTLSAWQSSGFLDVVIDAALQTEMDNLVTTTNQSIFTFGKQLEQAATKEALATEKTRIDNFTTLAAGSTTGDAELIDGRTGADSKVYPNIGAAIRGQAIKSNITVEDVSSALGVVYSQFKLGCLDISANNMIEVTYLADRRVINPLDRPIKLKVGDVIKVKSTTNFTMRVYFKSNGTWGFYGWTNTDYTVDVDGDYYLLMRTSGETVPVTDYRQLSDNIVIVRKNTNSLYNMHCTNIATSGDRIRAIGYRDLKMEYGNLDGLSESTYMSDRRVRTPVNNLVYLKKDDTVTLTDFSNALFYMTHQTADGTIARSGALSTKYTVQENGYYGIVIRKGAESTAIANVYELASLLQIETQSSIHQGVVEDGNWLPAYYYANGWMDNVLAKIREKSRIKNGVTFAFLTDLHFPFNSKNSKYLLKKILRNTTVPYVICGGDFPEAYGSESALYEAGRNFVEYNNYIGKDSFFTIRGNHDFTIKTSAELVTGATGTGATLPESTTYDYLMRNQERWVESDGGMYAYLDNKAQKTRIFLLNSCESGHSTDPTASWGLAYKVGQAQIDWLIANMTNVSGYKFIFISHVPADAAMVSYHPSQEIFHRLFVGLKNKTAVNYTADGETAIADFTGSTNTAICNITGHNHIDSSHVNSGFLSISTTSDAHYTDDGWGAVKNTVTEQAIDVYCFDFDAGTINTVRVGRGNDRTWTY